MEITKDIREGQASLVLVGRFDATWSEGVADVLDECVRAGAHAVRLDLDGIVFLSPLIPGNLASISISTMNATGAQAQLQGWIDWNGNGILESSEELGFLYPGGGAVIPYPVPTGNDVCALIEAIAASEAAAVPQTTPRRLLGRRASSEKPS